jgi:hypothetical protein
VDRRQNLLGLHFTNAREGVFEDALLDGNLCRQVHVLERAAAAQPEIGAARRCAARRGLEHCRHAPDLERGFSTINRGGYALARQRPFDEYRLPLASRNAPAFLVERFDAKRC